MRMRKEMIIIGMICAILLIGGCTGGGSGGSKVVDVRKGFDGLSLEFHPNAPPANSLVNSTIDIIAKVTNKGASNATGILVLSLEKGYMDLESGQNKVKFQIPGKTIYYPDDQQEFYEFTAEVRDLDPLLEKHNSIIIGTICYNYTTTASYDICVDTDVYGQKIGMKPCTSSDIQSSSGQGGPVAVTNIEQKTRESDGTIRPMFIITVENKGDGLVMNQALVEKTCGSDPIMDIDWNLIQIEAKLGAVSLQCDPGHIDLKEKKDRIRCIYPEYSNIERTQGNYMTNLNIKLNYGYTTSKSKTVTIEKI
ncbi:hypothetical protein JW968_03260 [Candidatus Woesearchaeota archaeon]|nr:hypothetical protein [Candidatus Woesearchaeota archaeon]